MTRSTHADNFVRHGHAAARPARDFRGPDPSDTELDIHEAIARPAVDSHHSAGS